MSDFVSRYGTDHNGQPEGCPDGMYPWDVKYQDQVVDTLDDLKEQAYFDSLNVPISWFFYPEDAEENGELAGRLELVWVMPRKYGDTWSIQVKAGGYDRAEAEAWLDEFSREAAAEWFGWTETPSV